MMILISISLQTSLSCILLSILSTKCYSWNLSFINNKQTAKDEWISNRRQMLYKLTPIIGSFPASTIFPPPANAQNDIVTITIYSPNDPLLGIQISDATMNGKTVITIDKIGPNKTNRLLQEGMILMNDSITSSKDLVNRIKSGPYPIELNFYNLASGGDAIGDLGRSIVKPKDALQLQKVKNDNQLEYKVTTIESLNPNEQCAIKSRRNDVLEIDYEAYYIKNDQKIIYDSSLLRGQAYQMVLGSGDMIPGVDQGLYEMCPGETRLLEIPPALGHGPRSLQVFRIPLDYEGLVWKIHLVSIDSTVKRDNNVVERDDRESRFSY